MNVVTQFLAGVVPQRVCVGVCVRVVVRVASITGVGDGPRLALGVFLQDLDHGILLRHLRFQFFQS